MGGLTVRKKGRDTIFLGGRNCRKSFSARNGGVASQKPPEKADFGALFPDENRGRSAMGIARSLACPPQNPSCKVLPLVAPSHGA